MCALLSELDYKLVNIYVKRKIHRKEALQEEGLERRMLCLTRGWIEENIVVALLCRGEKVYPRWCKNQHVPLMKFWMRFWILMAI